MLLVKMRTNWNFSILVRVQRTYSSRVTYRFLCVFFLTCDLPLFVRVLPLLVFLVPFVRVPHCALRLFPYRTMLCLPHISSAQALHFCVSDTVLRTLFARCLTAVRVCFECTIARPVDAIILEDETLPVFRGLEVCITHIADSSLFQLERPHHHGMDKVTFSTYMAMHSAKVLLSMSPIGQVNFVSNGYGASASDHDVAAASNFYEAAAGGCVMFDKGGSEMRRPLLEQGATLVTPAFVTHKFLLVGEVGMNKRIAHARVHIERAIERVKRYRIVSQRFPSSLLHMFDDIVFVAAYLSHFMGPVIAVKKSKPDSDDDDDDGEDVGDASAYGTWSEDDDDGDNDYDGDTGSEADDVVHAATVDDADAADMSWHHADSDGPFELQVLDHNF